MKDGSVFVFLNCLRAREGFFNEIESSKAVCHDSLGPVKLGAVQEGQRAVNCGEFAIKDSVM